MTTRYLHPSEWPKLAGTELGESWRCLKPETAEVLVVEDDGGTIIGCWAIYKVMHVDGIWVHPDHRAKGGVFRRLIVGMRHLASEMNAEAVVAACITPNVQEMLENAGATRIDALFYSVKV